MSELQFEHGIVKEIGNKEVIVSAANKEYHITLSNEEEEVIQILLLEEDVPYVLIDTKNNRLVFEDELNMTEHHQPELADLESDAVDSDGYVK
ncbi:hypothetical protein [Sinobaca sp. H24]|uniref:hypothetical protein n=1 Tax=Sinobaca sp. H24 TaxID=2923376 RepID=UPI00207A85E8|nr:hypothetical protein [Sinobaca sp. H24]